MTLQELQSEVLSLMFETEFDDSASFIHSVNRALGTIHTEKDRISEMYIYKPYYKAEYYKEHIKHRGGEDIKIILNGRSFSFISSGQGTLTIQDGDSSREIRFYKNREVIKEFISSGMASLTFSGEFDYEIFRLSSFSFKRSSEKKDIPLAEDFTCYDMKELDPYFLAFTDEARDFQGKKIPGCSILSSVIKVPFNYEGEIIVKYKRLCKKIADGDLDGIVDVSEDCEHILALLVASYLLSDDNSELSVYYMNLYRDAISSVRVYNRKGPDTNYEDVLGWAK